MVGRRGQEEAPLALGLWEPTSLDAIRYLGQLREGRLWQPYSERQRGWVDSGYQVAWVQMMMRQAREADLAHVQGYQTWI
jgi:hypothetical protein